MKTSMFMCGLLLMVGCARPLPPQPPQPVVVTVRPIHDLPKVKGETVVQEEEPVKVDVTKTWMTQEEADNLAAQRLQQAIEDAVKNGGCMCHPGDPLCSCL